MTDLPSSSQETFYEQNKILLDQENLASSPPRSQSSLKIKKPPTVTPKRFTKFFTPRTTLSSRGGRQSKAGRQLQDITRNGVNWGRSSLTLGDDYPCNAQDNILSSRPSKRRRMSADLASSPPQSSPLKHVQTNTAGPPSPALSEFETLPDLFQELRPYPQPIRRLLQAGSSRRILERSFGGFHALSYGRREPDHGVDYRAETADFTSSPTDFHAFRGTALPFCTAACNTNSLIAIGDEEGNVRLIDSSPSSQFNQTHVRFRVHHNAVMDVTFSPDDFVLATASGDQTARVVDMQTQKSMCILTGHTSSVKQVRFRPGDDSMITTSARDGTVQLWDLRCGGKTAVQSFRTALGQQVDSEGNKQPQVRYSQQELEVGYGHRSSHRPFEPGNRNELSITSFQHLPHGREHLILTASEVDATVKLWDLRNSGRRNPIPLSSTPLPKTHQGTRHYGINSMALSGDGARLYTVCRDATIYAYSTNSLVLGNAPEMSSAPSRRRMLKEPKTSLAPLYGFKHSLLRVGTFYIKASLRPARGNQGEMLAVGSTDKCPLLFPTDERYLPRLFNQNLLQDQEPNQHDDDSTGLPSFLPNISRNSAPARPGSKLNPEIFQHGTALVRAHTKEVTSLAWTNEGNLVTCSDDFTARCWREDANKARELRQQGETGGGRWRSGWAEVDAAWDEEEG